MKLKKEDYVRPDDGSYIAEVFKVEEFSSEKHPEWGPSIKFSFKILEEPFVGSIVTGLVNSQWRPDNKLDKWLRGLGINASEIGAEIEPSQLKGIKARILVETNQKDYVTVKHVTALKPNELNMLANQNVNQVINQTVQIPTVTLSQQAPAVIPVVAPVIPQVAPNVVQPVNPAPVNPAPAKRAIPF